MGMLIVTPMLVGPMFSQTLQLILWRKMGHYATGLIVSTSPLYQAMILRRVRWVCAVQQVVCMDCAMRSSLLSVLDKDHYFALLTQ